MDDKKNEKKKEAVKQDVILGSEATPESEEDAGQASMTEQKDVLSQKLEETEDKYRRALADYQNLVRRTQEEKREWARISNKDLVLKLLPILDTLMLAEKHTKDQNFTLTVQQFLQVLQDEGIAKIKTTGEVFDPLLMEVVETRSGDEGKVLEEVKAGFTLGETILRPALVVVGKKD